MNTPGMSAPSKESIILSFETWYKSALIGSPGKTMSWLAGVGSSGPPIKNVLDDGVKESDLHGACFGKPWILLFFSPSGKGVFAMPLIEGCFVG